MTTSLKYFSIAVVGGLMALTAFALYSTAHANPSNFQRSQLAAATSSVSYLTAGTGTTTTPTWDTANSAAGSVDGATFAVQFTGSSTASTLNIAFEYSQDGIDWYSDDYLLTPATTTPSAVITLTNTKVYSLPFASTTVGGAVGTGNGRITRIVNVPTPTRYVRAVMTLPIGSLNGAVWGEFIGKRQNP